MVEKENKKLSIRKQCELLALNRSSLYYEQVGLSEEDQQILEEMDKIYLDFPSYGSGAEATWIQSRAFQGEEDDEASGDRGDLSPKEVESSSHRASDLSLFTPGGRDRPAKQGLGS